MRFFKKLGLVVAVVAAATLMSSKAEAAAFTIDFCPEDATCPDGVSEASLTFDEILLGDDPNDYEVTITIVGDGTSPTYIDEVGFAVSGVATPAGYEAEPTLTSAPADGSPWDVFFDNVNGGGGCGDVPLSSQMVCAQSTEFGALTDGTNEWVFLVDLVDAEGAISTESTINLRAQFLTAEGKNAGILSPGGGHPSDGEDDIIGDDDGQDVDDVVGPEPASMLLFGVGLSAAAFGARRRNKKA